MKSIDLQPDIRDDRYRDIELRGAVRDAYSDERRRIDIFVGWDGVSDLGTFQVTNMQGIREDCGNLEPDAINDVIRTGIERNAEDFVVRIERDPKDGASDFEAWACAIKWESNAVSQEEFTASFNAILGTHYNYVDGIRREVQSTLDNGIQVASLELASSLDWELRVRLRHPTQDTWLVLDPVIRSGDRNSTPASSE